MQRDRAVMPPGASERLAELLRTQRYHETSVDQPMGAAPLSAKASQRLRAGSAT